MTIQRKAPVNTRVTARLAIAVAVLIVPSLAVSGRTAESPAVRVEAPAPAPAASAVVRHADAGSAFDAATWDAVALGAVDRDVFSLALQAAAAAVERGDATNPGTLTVIDFSRPSTARRMWVYDLRARALLFEEFVAHGRGSGANFATEFSNVPESNRSSLGLYRTGEAYIGKHGYSLRLDGLERGINNRARDRAIVVHGADYVNAATARAQGRLGRSLGCPAVRPEISRPLIEAVKDGGLLFAYYPDQSWLNGSTYLN